MHISIIRRERGSSCGFQAVRRLPCGIVEDVTIGVRNDPDTVVGVLERMVEVGMLPTGTTWTIDMTHPRQVSA